MKKSKPYEIPKTIVLEAYKKVKRNKGSAGIDGITFDDFEKNLKGNLYKIWNRMSSGSYFPSPVLAVEIPKKTGGTRKLGIPTISDRIAQMVARGYVESKVEPIFHQDSYGYRPGKSALDAVGKARERTWKFDYVLELDIKGLFDNIDHKLLMKAVEKHVEEKWVKLYIERWLVAPFETNEGDIIERKSGTPQGGVISPVLANLFMHYAFDVWMKTNYPDCLFERYADDAIVHCKTLGKTKRVLKSLEKRMNEIGLQLHPEKTRIAYCKDEDRKGEYPITEFEFLGYTYKARYIRCRDGKMRNNFICYVSKQSGKFFRDKIKTLEIHKKTGSTIQMISEILNPLIRGWMNYFGKYSPSAMKYTLAVIENRIIKWAMSKYKYFRGRRKRAEKWLSQVKQREPALFAHWKLGKDIIG
jgi:group II intron reverse transcriptase/maturase